MHNRRNLALPDLYSVNVASIIADFLVYKVCGVFAGVCYQAQGQIYAAINSETIDESVESSVQTVVPPEQSGGYEKTKR